MATIEKRTSQDNQISYRVKVRLKGFPTQSATFDRLTDARKWAQQTEAAIREGRHFKIAEAKKHTLAEAVDRYIVKVLSKKPKLIRDQTTQLTWWKNTIGYLTLDRVTPPIISEYKDKLLEGKTVRKKSRSAATVNRYLAALSKLFTVSVNDWGWVEENPVLKVSKENEPRGRVRFLSNTERARLLEITKESDNPYLHIAFVLALSTGARKMELMNLKWPDVDLTRSVITLHETKNGERRLLPIAGYALKLMLEHSKIRRLDTDYVFPSHDGKKPMDIRKPWETALKKAGIENYRWHDNRHSAASYLAMDGASLAEIAEILGHKTLHMVKRYAHLSDAHTASVVASMNERIFG